MVFRPTAKSGPDQRDFMALHLRALGKRTKKQGKELLVQCLNPGHPDKSPSMAIKGDGSAFLCRSCGFRGSWRKLVSQFGLPDLPGAGAKGDDVDTMNAELRSMLNAPLARTLNEVPLPPGLRPWPGGTFRGFSEKTLNRLGTQLWLDRGITRVFWPFYQEGRLVGGTGRVHPDDEPKPNVEESAEDFKARLKQWYRESHPKYRNVHGVSAKRVLYPYDLYQHPKTIVLVEGPTSAIRLIDAGIPTYAILGVENWSSDKRALLHKKGVRNVVLCFDGDEAGRTATATVIADLRDGMAVYPVDLPEGVDPGDMDEKWIQFLQSEVKRI